jgi:hypothetical protein
MEAVPERGNLKSKEGSPMAMKTKRLKKAKKLVATKPLKHKLAP